MTFYFAWIGGSPIPAFDLVTNADIWGGSVEIVCQVWAGQLTTTADFLPSGNWRSKVTAVTNMRDVAGLVVGRVYKATIGEIISDFTYAGNFSGTLSNSRDAIGLPYFQNGVYPLEAGTMLLQSDTGILDVILDDTTKLEVGTVYGISGSGISNGTFGTFTGSNTITTNNANGATGQNVTLTFSTDVGSNIIKNLASTAGLVVGDVYQIFGRGLPPTVLATFQGDNTFLLTEFATISTKQAHIRVHHGIIYPDGGAFVEATHARNDEIVLSINIRQTEGEAALLTIDLKNPKIGFLAPGRNVWCWLSWREIDGVSPSAAVPLFHGRLVTVPDNIQDEKVRLQFIAKPGEFEDKQAVLAATLKVAPYWDPIWYDNGVADKDTILETRTALYHIDRTTLAVTISDIITGEDGTIEVAESDHLYGDMNYKINTPPLSSVYITGTVTWNQIANGALDLTNTISKIFKDGGSAYGQPNIAAYQGSGLLSNWPKPLQNIGAGWQVGVDTLIIENTRMFGTTDITTKYTTSFSAGQDFDDSAVDEWGNPTGSTSRDAQGSYTETHAIFKMSTYRQSLFVTYGANRAWTETVSFFLEADVQQVASDSRASTEAFSLSSDLVGKRIDPGGAIPLRDLRDNTYFKNSRGQNSFKFLLLYGKAKLVARARAVQIKFTTTWHKGVDVTCRKNIHILDNRLPGGEATGKVVEYEISASADEGMKVVVTMGCTVGNGGSLSAVAGTPTYVEDGYVNSGYQTETGGTVDLGDGTVTYETFDDFEIVDDGVNFFNLTPDTAIKRTGLVGGITQQQVAIAATIPNPVGGAFAGAVQKQPLDPSTILNNCYPSVLIEFVPVTGGAFLSEFFVDVSKLQITKTVNLAAT